MPSVIHASPLIPQHNSAQSWELQTNPSPSCVLKTLLCARCLLLLFVLLMMMMTSDDCGKCGCCCLLSVLLLFMLFCCCPCLPTSNNNISQLHTQTQTKPQDYEQASRKWWKCREDSIGCMTASASASCSCWSCDGMMEEEKLRSPRKPTKEKKKGNACNHRRKRRNKQMNAMDASK